MSDDQALAYSQQFQAGFTTIFEDIDEPLQIAILGSRGKGKNLLMSFWSACVPYWQDVMSNFWLNPVYQPSNREAIPFDFIEIIRNKRIGMVSYDEFHNLAGQYGNGTKRARIARAIFSQSRKLGQSIVISTQRESFIPKDFRTELTHIVEPQFDKERNRFKATLYDIDKDKVKPFRIDDPKQFYLYYNTKQIMVQESVNQILLELLTKESKAYQEFKKYVDPEIVSELEDDLELIKRV